MRPIIVIACIIVFAASWAIVAWHVYWDARRHKSEDAEMLEHLRRSIGCE